MLVTPARAVAYHILRRVESGRAFAVDLLQKREVSSLKEVDRRLATQLVMGVLRWRGALDFEIGRVSGKPLGYFDPEILTILRLGVYQLRLLERVPKRAVVNEAVELTKAARKRSAAGLVNAVLRKCEALAAEAHRRKPPALDPELADMACRSVPGWMLERWAGWFGAEVAAALARQSTATPATTLRVAAEGDRAPTEREVAGEGVKTRPGQYSGLALLVEAGDVRATRAFREGRVVIQDEASQLVAQLVQPGTGESVLDLCAAPGTKTGHLASALSDGRLVACDLSARRLAAMPGLSIQGVPAGVRLLKVRLDAARSLPFRSEFQRVLLDAPCSGTGTLARNPEIKWRLRPEDVLRLAVEQEKMLACALEALALGGRLVYATCSLEPEENEQVIEKVLAGRSEYRLLGAAELSREFPSFTELFDPAGYFRTRPDLHSMDGFFAAVIERPSQRNAQKPLSRVRYGSRDQS